MFGNKANWVELWQPGKSGSLRHQGRAQVKGGVVSLMWPKGHSEIPKFVIDVISRGAAAIWDGPSAALRMGLAGSPWINIT